MIIRQLKTHKEYKDCEDTMKKIWQFTDRDVIPSHLLKPLHDQGGLVLGAYENDEMIGMLVGFLALYKGILHHHSHVTGVVTQLKGVGYQLKQKQRDFALSQGLNLVTWTFDPLQSANAYFNFAKLGVICNTYYENYYGEMRDSLNKGLVSDRFFVEWWITADEVVQRVDNTYTQPVLHDFSPTEFVTKTEKIQNVRRITSFDLHLDSENLLVEIPSNIAMVKSEAIELAQEWRDKTRQIFKTYFSRGYTACNVLSEGDTERRTFYLLRRDQNEHSKN